MINIEIKLSHFWPQLELDDSGRNLLFSYALRIPERVSLRKLFQKKKIKKKKTTTKKTAIHRRQNKRMKMAGGKKKKTAALLSFFGIAAKKKRKAPIKKAIEMLFEARGEWQYRSETSAPRDQQSVRP